MTPTFTLPTNTSANPLQGSTTNLLPGEATEPVAAFATEMKLYRTPSTPPPESGEWMPVDGDGESGEWMFEGTDNLATGGDLLPLDGKDLPAKLQVILDELRESLVSEDLPPVAQGFVADDAAPAVASVEPEIALNTEFPVLNDGEIELPPGLTFETQLTTLPPTIVPVDTPPSSRAAESSPPAFSVQPGAATGAADLQPDAQRQALIERLSRMVNVSAERIQTVAEQRDIQTADLKRITDFLASKPQAADVVLAAQTESPGKSVLPVPAPMARIDGRILDGKSLDGRGERFRPIGVGQPQGAAESRLSPTVVELDVTTAELNRTTQQATQPRADVVASEVLRQESMANLKPAPGSFQVAAPQQSPPNITAPQSYQPVDVGSKPLPGSIDVPVKDAAWGERLNERVVMMANNRLQNVDLRLSPAEMGPLRVKVSVEDGTANVSFVAQHAVTREAIEQALPRLKSLLEQNGIDLGNTSVDQQSPDQGAADGDGAEPSRQEDIMEARAGGSPSGEPDATSDSRRAVRLSRGLLDTFA